MAAMLFPPNGSVIHSFILQLFVDSLACTWLSTWDPILIGIMDFREDMTQRC